MAEKIKYDKNLLNNPIHGNDRREMFEPIADVFRDILQERFNYGSDSPAIWIDYDKDTVTVSTCMYIWGTKSIRGIIKPNEFFKALIELIIGLYECTNDDWTFDEILLDYHGITIE